MGYGIFALTMFCVYMRPFKLPIWVFSTLGALCVFVFGVVSLADIMLVWEITKPSTFALIGLILLSLAFEKLGFFTHLASCITPRTHSIRTWKFFVLLIVLGSVVSIVFANDGAILVLTPLVFALFSNTHDKAALMTTISPLVVFLLLVSFVSDFASNALVISNLTNIITAQMFSIEFVHFALSLAIPQIFGLCMFVGVAWLCFRRFLPHTLHFSPESSTKAYPSTMTLVVCYVIVVMLLGGIVFGERYGVKLYVFLFGASFVALVYAKILQVFSFKSLVQETPFCVIVFSFGLFVVVFGVKNAGFLESMREIFSYVDSAPLFVQIFSVGIFSSLGSSVINNLPMVLLGNLTLQSFGLDSLREQALVFAHILGCNIGSKLTPIGSLATLLFLLKLRIYGIKIALWQYMAFALILSVCVLFAALFGLWISTLLFMP